MEYLKTFLQKSIMTDYSADEKIWVIFLILTYQEKKSGIYS